MLSIKSEHCAVVNNQIHDILNNDIVRNTSSFFEKDSNDSDDSAEKKKRTRKLKAKNPLRKPKAKVSRRERANDRERNRMHGLNDALEELRTLLPSSVDGKLTKIETLRTAYNYIYALGETLKLMESDVPVGDGDTVGNTMPNVEHFGFPTSPLDPPSPSNSVSDVSCYSDYSYQDSVGLESSIHGHTPSSVEYPRHIRTSSEYSESSSFPDQPSDSTVNVSAIKHDSNSLLWDKKDFSFMAMSSLDTSSGTIVSTEQLDNRTYNFPLQSILYSWCPDWTIIVFTVISALLR